MQTSGFRANEHDFMENLGAGNWINLIGEFWGFFLLRYKGVVGGILKYQKLVPLVRRCIFG